MGQLSKGRVEHSHDPVRLVQQIDVLAGVVRVRNGSTRIEANTVHG